MYGLGIAALILLGVILFLMEVLVIPGIGFAGIGSFVLIAFGVFLSYQHYGNEIGNYTLFGSLVFFVGMTIYALRAKTWKRLTLESAIDSKVNVLTKEDVNIGDEGIAVSRLAPMGKVQINNKIYEGKSLGEYITENTPIVVLKVNESNVIVKPTNS
ncbi:MAG TPA: NfeD family protein [Bacteroidales bacterium]|nr:NfeD family protein [Bacteroidales bacterium]